MQTTVASLAKRLDMSAETAVERLRYMLCEVEGEDSQITDEECDLLIDLDEEPEVADRVRAERLEEIEKAKQLEDRKKAAAEKKAEAAKKKAAAAKKKAAAAKKKAAAEKKKTATKKKTPAKKKAAKKKAAKKKDEEKAAPEPVEIIVEPEALAEMLPPEEHKEEEQESVPAEAGATKSSIVIGSAIEHDKLAVEVERADGTHVDAHEIELTEISTPAPVVEEEPVEARPLPTPDPAVVAEVKRRAALRAKRKAGRAGKAAPQQTATAPKLQSAPTKGKKGSRKRGKKIDRVKNEDLKRREAAAAVRVMQSGGAPKKRKRKRGLDGADIAGDAVEALKPLDVEEDFSVENLANAMEVSVNEIILDLMEQNVLATKNQVLAFDVIKLIAESYGFDAHPVIPEETELLVEEEDKPEDLKPRAPVITVMGHVDHGKTSFLDVVRKENVADGEAGGITQHIAAYDVKFGKGSVTFLDTPGHEAFTAMRARGAQVTDVVVLVVAADDGVMPQTIEAIDHAKDAEVPIVVAINKCDKPNAQPDRIRQELSNYDLLDEQWGGKTIMKEISAKTKEGIDELMELLVLESEMLELKANPDKLARATIVESEISKGLGPVAWTLVQSGTLKVGDSFLAGQCYGRVRSMHNSRNESVTEAGPATPVIVTGFSAPPDAGDKFIVVEDERVARGIAEKRAEHNKLKQGPRQKHITLEDFHDRMMAGEQKELKVVVKADVQGSVDVLCSSLKNLGNEEVSISIVHSGVGGINESDVLLASATDAVIIGFHVTANVRGQKQAEKEGVDIRTYQVIYEVMDNLKRALEGMLTPEAKEVEVGQAEIRAVFKSSALGNIAGCSVRSGEITRASLARLLRDNVVIYEGKVGSLRREKEDAKSVSQGFECGIKLDKFDDIKEGDVIQAYRIDSVAKTLA